MFIKHTLPNGLRIVSEKIPYVRSVSIGIWVKTGSRNENEQNNGISHFIEHMLFKGTEKRSAKEIAESIDNIGGQLNAFTGKECTCFYAKTLDEHLDLAIDVLSDMFFNSLFASKDMTVEKKVVLEEIGMYEDSPEELVHDILSETVWDGNPIGYPILGSKKSLKSIDIDAIRDYMNNNYTPENTVVAVAGNFDEKHLNQLVEKYFGSWVSKGTHHEHFPEVRFIPAFTTKEKDIEQVHLCMGFEGIEHGNDRLYSLLAINNILGGGMSSRLFQKIREKKGLVYSIYSYPSAYKHAGLFTIYAGMKPENLDHVREHIQDEIRLLRKKGIKPDDLMKSKDQLKGGYILGLESTSSRMNSIGKAELMLGYIDTPDQVLQKIDNISMEKVDEIIKTVFTPENIGVSIVGRLKPGSGSKAGRKAGRE
ncbi:MAG: insulinase family protein [Clostridiales bacterium]|nr:insulinase family protein [Clostridiales bacterium]